MTYEGRKLGILGPEGEGETTWWKEPNIVIHEAPIKKLRSMIFDPTARAYNCG